jgi:AcrR family transcriptional regulator
MTEAGGPRKQRTRNGLIEAFNEIVLSRRRGPIRAPDVIERAKVGRSTFYEHFSSADELHLKALEHPLSILADALTGRAPQPALAGLLRHFWENRVRARDTFGGPLQPRVRQLLAELVAARLDSSRLRVPAPLAAAHLAEGALGSIRLWLFGAAPCDPNALAQAISDAALAALEALRRENA